MIARDGRLPGCTPACRSTRGSWRSSRLRPAGRPRPSVAAPWAPPPARPPPERRRRGEPRQARTGAAEPVGHDRPAPSRPPARPPARAESSARVPARQLAAQHAPVHQRHRAPSMPRLRPIQASAAPTPPQVRLSAMVAGTMITTAMASGPGARGSTSRRRAGPREDVHERVQHGADGAQAQDGRGVADDVGIARPQRQHVGGKEDQDRAQRQHQHGDELREEVILGRDVAGRALDQLAEARVRRWSPASRPARAWRRRRRRACSSRTRRAEGSRSGSPGPVSSAYGQQHGAGHAAAESQQRTEAGPVQHAPRRRGGRQAAPECDAEDDRLGQQQRRLARRRRRAPWARRGSNAATETSRPRRRATGLQQSWPAPGAADR